jgi:hypothetical protein
MKRLILALGVAAALLVGTLTPGTASAAAINLGVANPQCVDGRVHATLTWTPSGWGGWQWADIATSSSIYSPIGYNPYVLYDPFFPGSFVGIGPLSPWQGSLELTDLQPGMTYLIRVNTLEWWGWIGSQTIAFTAPACGTVQLPFPCNPPPGPISPVLSPCWP